MVESAGDKSPHAVEPLGIPSDVFCQECGYNLRGLTGVRCPECGYEHALLRSQISRIPWAHRDKIGFLRAYWLTVLWVSVRYKRFCEEIVRPVDYGAAQRFRWVTIIHTYLPFLAATVVLYIAAGPRPFNDSALDAAFRAVWPAALLNVGFIASMITITGLPSYFFDCRDAPVQQRNSAIAMSYYCAGALAWSAIPATAGILSPFMIAGRKAEIMGLFLFLFAVLVPLGLMAAWWLDLIHTMKRVIPGRPKRTVALAMLTPVLWIVVGGGVFWLPVFVGVYLSTIVDVW